MRTQRGTPSRAQASTPLAMANWKMNKTIPEALSFASAFTPAVAGIKTVEIVLCPPFIALPALAEAFKGSHVRLGAQNTHVEPSGTFTGEISVPMLKGLVDYVLVGHSDRRTHFGEDNALLNKKLQAVLEGGLTPVLCVGETRDQREAGKAQEVVTMQVREGLKGVTAENFVSLVMAYEPVWAISQGPQDTETKSCSPEDAQEMHALIRSLLVEQGGGTDIRTLYGGSARPDNVASFVSQPDIDGVLVGGASLDPESFAAIARNMAQPGHPTSTP